MTSKILNVLLVICVGTCLFTIGFHMLNQKYKTETAVLSTTDDSISFKGVYVRDESVVKYGGTGSVSYCVSDGGKLGKGSVIAEIYNDEAQIDIKQRLAALNDELSILRKIQNPGTLKSAQPANIATLIDEQYKSVVESRERGNFDELSSSKNELFVLLSTYQLVTAAEVDFNNRINEINAEISKLKLSETVALDTIVSGNSAYFVSYADGYEDTLKPENLNSITPEMINEVKDSGPVDDNTVVGKLINSYEWYIVGVIDNRKMGFAVDDEIDLKFQSISDTAKGVIYDIRSTDKAEESIVVIKCDDITYDLVQHRSERVEMIADEFEGIKVPRKAIRFLDMEETVYDEETGAEKKEIVNCKGVYVKLGERVSFKKIKIVHESSDYVLSEVNAGDGYLALYDDIVVEGVETDEN